MAEDEAERIARNAIEESTGHIVLNANVLFRAQCPNIDLIIFGKKGTAYVQVKSSSRPSSKKAICIDGSPWTKDQLEGRATVFNKTKDGHQASLVAIVDRQNGDAIYLAPPKVLERALRARGRAFAAKPKKDGAKRSVGFRKELPRTALKRHRENWSLLKNL